MQLSKKFPKNNLPVKNIAGVLKREIPSLTKDYKVKSLALFGSFIRGEQKKSSDLDLLVEFSKSPSLFTFIGLENYLSDQLGIKVDLVMKDALKPNIGKRILSEMMPV